MITSIALLNPIDGEKLNAVIAEMKEMGAPTLRGIVTEDCTYIIEGSHRVKAASILGLTINIIDISADIEDVDEEIQNDIDGLDIQDRCSYWSIISNHNYLISAEVEVAE